MILDTGAWGWGLVYGQRLASVFRIALMVRFYRMVQVEVNWIFEGFLLGSVTFLGEVEIRDCGCYC